MTGISWTDKTWNPTLDVVIDPAKLSKPLSWRKPSRVFVNSMSDLFHEALTNEQIAAVFGVMAACPQHTFQVLTKRARRMREWFAWASTAASLSALFGYAEHTIDDHDGRIIGMLQIGKAWPLPNVWLGVSVEDQAAADERIPDLLATPAAVRFLSCEPLLGPVQLDNGESSWLTCHGPKSTDDEAQCCESRYTSGWHFHGIDWVIAGCESGAGARQCEVDWLRSLRDQCAAAGAAFFLKQATEEGRDEEWECSVTFGEGSKLKPGGIIELPYLDGVQHAAFPVTP